MKKNLESIKELLEDALNIVHYEYANDNAHHAEKVVQDMGIRLAQLYTDLGGSINDLIEVEKKVCAGAKELRKAAIPFLS